MVVGLGYESRGGGPMRGARGGAGRVGGIVVDVGGDSGGGRRRVFVGRRRRRQGRVANVHGMERRVAGRAEVATSDKVNCKT